MISQGAQREALLLKAFTAHISILRMSRKMRFIFFCEGLYVAQADYKLLVGLPAYVHECRDSRHVPPCLAQWAELEGKSALVLRVSSVPDTS